MGIREDLARIGEEMRAQLNEATTTQALDQIRVSVLGKKGALTALLRGMGQLPAERRRAIHRRQCQHAVHSA